MRYFMILACLVAACSNGEFRLDFNAVEGTVTSIQAQSAFAVIDDEGRRYDPVNLPDEFAVEGMRIEFDARRVEAKGEPGDPERVELVRIDEVDGRGGTFRGEGTVVFVDLEGGFFAIRGDDGGRYDPVDLPVGFQVDGQRVRFHLVELRDRAGFHMWGRIVSVVGIEVR